MAESQEEDGAVKFDEPDCQFVDVNRENACYIYFLLDDDEVVYVGQTRNGFARMYQHTDKVFNKACAKPCCIQDLDYLENKYILKYRPRYNKQPNYRESISLQRVKRMAREMANESDLWGEHEMWRIDLRMVRDCMKKLKVKTHVFDNVVYVSRGDAVCIASYIAFLGM